MPMGQRVRQVIKFQKTLALFAGASTLHEAEAAELGARRVMQACDIDPVVVCNSSLYDYTDFGDNALLKKLRDEWRETHPNYWYKTYKDGSTRRLRRKPRPKRATLDPDLSVYAGLFDDFTAFD